MALCVFSAVVAIIEVMTIIGGGDSIAATEPPRCAGDMSHILTGGGATLELLMANNCRYCFG